MDTINTHHLRFPPCTLEGKVYYPSQAKVRGRYFKKLDIYVSTTNPEDFSRLEEDPHVKINDYDPLLNQISQMELQAGSARLQLRSLYSRINDPELKKLVDSAINQVTAVENRNKQLKTLTEEFETVS